MIRKERVDKKKRIYPYLRLEAYKKLNRLAKACDVSVHELATDAINIAVNNPAFIVWAQQKYQVAADDSLRVIPLVQNGKVHY